MRLLAFRQMHDPFREPWQHLVIFPQLARRGQGAGVAKLLLYDLNDGSALLGWKPLDSGLETLTFIRRDDRRSGVSSRIGACMSIPGIVRRVQACLTARARRDARRG